MGQINITLRAINWTEGDVGYVCLLLTEGSRHVDWGDGTSYSINADLDGNWVGARHVYNKSCKKNGTQFNVTISSESDNIIGLDADSGDMNIDDVDISKCQSLKVLRASYLISHFDLTTNPGIESIGLQGEAAGIADFSKSTELKELTFNYTHGTGRALNLSKCDKLEYLECINSYLSTIKISNKSTLKKVVYNSDTPLDDRTLQIFSRIVVEKNGGEIIKESSL